MELSISILAGLIPMILWGIGDFLQSTLIRRIGTYKTIFIGNLIGLIYMIPFLFFVNFKTSTVNIIAILISSLSQMIGIYNFFKSIEIGILSIITPISASYPLITIFLLYLFIGKNISIMTLFAVLILVLGIILVSTDLKKIKHIHTVKGVKESIFALIFWGTSFFILDLAGKENNLFGIYFESMNPLTLFFYSNVSMGILMLIFSIIKKGFVTKKDIKNKYNIIVPLINNVIYAVAWGAITYGLAYGNTAIITPISSIYPAITIILAGIFYKEKIVLNQKIGIFTILLGLILISI